MLHHLVSLLIHQYAPIRDNIRTNFARYSQDAAFCDFSSFDPTAASDSQCKLYTSNTGTCAHEPAGYFTRGQSMMKPLVVSNGPCGQIVQGKPKPATPAGNKKAGARRRRSSM
jgi:hypothetical protein